MNLFKRIKPKIALVLGGGGARGIAHLGVLSHLEREGINFDMIVGTSIGAFIGALYLVNGSSERAFNSLLNFISKKEDDLKKIKKVGEFGGKEKKLTFFEKLIKIFSFGLIAYKSVFKESFVEEKKFRESIDELFSNIQIEDLKPKLAIVATDLSEGKEIVIEKGNLSDAVKASIAIAGVFPTTKMGEKVLIDGGYVNQIPVEVAFRLGADIVIAVDVSNEIMTEDRDEFKGYEIQMRAMMILADTARKHQIRFADAVINPDLKGYNWTDFDKAFELFEKGYLKAEEKIKEIKRVIFRAQLRKLFFPFCRRSWKIDLRR